MTRRRDAARAITLIALRIDNHDLAHLLHSRCATRKNIVAMLHRNLPAVAAIPARGVEQQKIDRLQTPGGLFGERICQVAEFAIGREDRIAIGPPGVVRRGAGECDDDENAEQDHGEPQALEPDRTGVE